VMGVACGVGYIADCGRELVNEIEYEYVFSLLYCFLGRGLWDLSDL
jgi:hypothetical protein